MRILDAPISMGAVSPPDRIPSTWRAGTATAREVQEVLYAFSQRCFIGQHSTEQLRYSEQDDLFELLSEGDLTVSQAHDIGEVQRDLLRELLSQYIIFLQMNQHLDFPEGFLDGSDNMRLGRPLLDYLCHHRWPFPQAGRGGRPANA